MTMLLPNRRHTTRPTRTCEDIV